MGDSTGAGGRAVCVDAPRSKDKGQGLVHAVCSFSGAQNDHKGIVCMPGTASGVPFRAASSLHVCKTEASPWEPGAPTQDTIRARVKPKSLFYQGKRYAQLSKRSVLTPCLP